MTSYNNVVNGNFESTCEGQVPAGWTQEVYGSVDATYSQVLDAYEGSKSAQVTISGAPNGEAGWASSPILIDGNDKVDVVFQYKSDVYLYAYAEIYDTNNQVTYTSLRSIVASDQGWGLYEDSFIAPNDAVNFILHIATSDIGTITIDGVSVFATQMAGSSQFSAPILSINFDDGWIGTYQNGEQLMREFGFLGTYYLNATTLNTNGYMNTLQAQDLVAHGNEIGSHGYRHVDMTSLTPQELQDEVSQNITALQAIVQQPITNFATPFGAYNTDVTDAIMSRHMSHRNTSGALNHKYNFSYSQIHSKVITKSVTVSEITALINQAKQENAWLVLTFHDISEDNGTGDEYTIGRDTFRDYLSAIRDSGITVKTNRVALTDITAQL